MKDLFDAIETLSLVASETKFIGHRHKKLLKPSGDEKLAVNTDINWNTFRGCEAFIRSESDQYLGCNEQENLYFDNNSNNLDKSLFNKFDTSFIKMWYEDENLHTLAVRVRSIPLSRLRGHGKIYSPYAAEVIASWWNSSEDVYRGKKSAFNLRGTEWVSNEAMSFISSKSYLRHDDVRYLSLHGHVDGDEFGKCEKDSDTINMAASIAFTRDLLWHIEVCLQSGMSIAFTTDAIGCHEAYKNRDKNGDRRDVLRHWVKQHYRNIATENSEGEQEIKQVFVRQHLRGKIPFKWCGLECNVVVSPFDLRRNERFKRERQNMKQLT